MARIKIEDISKGIKVSNEELKTIKGGLSGKYIPAIFTNRWFCRQSPPTSNYLNVEACQWVESGGCGTTSS